MIPAARLVAIVDSRQPQLRAYTRSLGLQVLVFRDLQRLLCEVEVDGVMSCTPPAMHRTIAEACVARGVHLLLEKPLAASWADAEHVVRLARAHPELVTASGYMLAYVPLVAQARAWLQAQRWGVPRRFEGSIYFTQVEGSGRSRRAWRYVPALSGGGVVSLITSHLLFVVEWFFGSPQSVRAVTTHHSAPVEDDAQVSLTYADGLQGHVESSWSRPGYPQLTLELHVECTRGWLHLTNEELTGGEPGAAATTQVRRSSLPVNGYYDLTGNRFDGQGYFDQDQDFLRCLGTTQRPRVTWEEAWRVQRVIQAMYDSAAQGREVVLA